MNANLYGKTILIGREQDQSRLYVCVIVGGQPYSFPLGLPQSVPNTVSRCQPKEGKAHCSISIDGKGRMLLSNLKTQNVTYVDGNEVLKKYFDETNRVTLGRNQFPIDVPTIVDTASKIVAKVTGAPEKQVPEYNIDHLKEIWDNYYSVKNKKKKKDATKNLLLTLPMVASVALGSLGHVFDMTTLGNVFIIIGVAYVIAFVYRLVHTNKDNDETLIAAQHKFVDSYVCPNEKCEQYLLETDFYVIKKRKKCPYCGCQFTSNL